MPSAAHCDRLVQNQPSLPKALQWLQWLRYHYDTLPAHPGWVRGVRDTLAGLHHTIAISARRLRGNPIWDVQGTMIEDTAPLEDVARHALAVFEQINRKDVPPRFDKVLDCLFGALRQQIRLAREIDRMRLMGQLEVDVLVDIKSETATEQ
jgi:hypothetical protein